VERGIICKLNLPQELSSLLGQGNVDIDAGSHFKSSGGSQPWDNLKMPMVVIFLLILNGSGMDDIIIIGIVQIGIEFKQGCL
jgi:hypothetical protein